MSEDGLLAGKAVVVSGSTRGLGRAYAVASARAGAAVVVNGRGSDGVAEVIAEIEAAGGTAVGYVGDVGELAGARALVARCVETFGTIDGMVTNAALPLRNGQPWRHEPDEVLETLRINTAGTIFQSMAALERMVEQGRGSLVTVISRAVLGIAGVAIYGASKGAVMSWTYCLALDLEGTGVRVNGLSPTAQTGMSAPVPGRVLPTPDTAAPMVVYLLSDLSADVSGSIFRIQGSQITTLAPPRFHPALEREEWSAPEIAAAVRSELAEQIIEDGRSTHYPEAARLRR